MGGIFMNIENYNEKIFEDIKHIDEEGNVYWFGRELMTVLKYSKWSNFETVVSKAKSACKLSNNAIKEHFADVGKLSKRANNAEVVINDYKLSRYACYLIAQNGDSRKESIALAQTYFAVQTRKMELTEMDYDLLTEDEKRFYQRNLTRKGNRFLNRAAKNAGVKNMAEFHNAGYKGLYNGKTANDIAKRKGLRYREDILDNMGEDELIANLFRISQTRQKLVKDNIKGESKAKEVHYEVGKKVRKAIADIGGIMPEDMPTPAKSLKELAIEDHNLIKK